MYIFFSSDAVFQGSDDMYYEHDTPNPVNYYGKTKAEAEKTALSYRSLCCRMYSKIWERKTMRIFANSGSPQWPIF